jgi:hypothetical protein
MRDPSLPKADYMKAVPNSVSGDARYFGDTTVLAALAFAITLALAIIIK